MIPHAHRADRPRLALRDHPAQHRDRARIRSGYVARRVILVLALAAAYVAGTLAPRATAADSLGGLISELRGIRSEITEIRRTLQRGSR